MKVYISGKISGLPQTEYMKKFMDAEIELRKKGYSVINPAKVNAMMPVDTTYEEYMGMSFTMLSFCDAIYLMDNWQDSNGAKMELQRAKKLGMETLYESEVA